MLEALAPPLHLANPFATGKAAILSRPSRRSFRHEALGGGQRAEVRRAQPSQASQSTACDAFGLGRDEEVSVPGAADSSADCTSLLTCTHALYRGICSLWFRSNVCRCFYSQQRSLVDCRHSHGRSSSKEKECFFGFAKSAGEEFSDSIHSASGGSSGGESLRSLKSLERFRVCCLERRQRGTRRRVTTSAEVFEHSAMGACEEGRANGELESAESSDCFAVSRASSPGLGSSLEESFSIASEGDVFTQNNTDRELSESSPRQSSFGRQSLVDEEGGIAQSDDLDLSSPCLHDDAFLANALSIHLAAEVLARPEVRESFALRIFGSREASLQARSFLCDLVRVRETPFCKCYSS